MLKPPVSSKLTRFVEPAPPSWEWDSVRHIAIGNVKIIRHTLVLRPEHLNIQTLSMGPIQHYDIGRQLIVDVYEDGRAIDIIQEAKVLKLTPLQSQTTESISATISAMVELQERVRTAITKLERVSSSEAKTVRAKL